MTRFRSIGRRARFYRAPPLSLCRGEGPGSATTFARLPYFVSLPESGFRAFVHRDVEGVFRCRWDLPYEKTSGLPGRSEAFARVRP